MRQIKFREIIVDKNENFVSSLGYIESKDTIEESALILTDRRIYYLGNIEYPHINDCKGKAIVQLENITAVWEIIKSSLSVLFTGIFLLVLGFISLKAALSINGTSIPLNIITSLILIFGISFIIAYFLSKSKKLIIEYSGGKIIFNSRNYSEALLSEFQKIIFYQKDILNSKIISKTV